MPFNKEIKLGISAFHNFLTSTLKEKKRKIFIQNIYSINSRCIIVELVNTSSSSSNNKINHDM